MNGAEKLCLALYGRAPNIDDSIGGMDARMLHDAAAVLVEMAECKALLRDILPDMEHRVRRLTQAWPLPTILTILHRNESHVRRIKELLR